MPMPDDFSSESSNKEICIQFFKKLFSPDELKEKIREFSPENIKKKSRGNVGNRKSLYDILNIGKINDHYVLAESLYSILGPHFLYEVQGAAGPMDESSKRIRYEIIRKAIDLHWFTEDTVNRSVSSLPRRSGISKLEDILVLKIPGPWQHKMLELLSNDLPSEVAEAPTQLEERKNNIEVITAKRELKPLHDYQIFAGKKIRDLITKDKNTRKRLLISIPTGAGKTRLVAESLIDWLNDGKQSDDPKIHNSKYMIWIAQSRELCEQAISQFDEVYSQKGRSALTIFRLFGNHPLTLPTILAQRAEHGLIVCTIDKIYNQINDKEKITDFNKDFFQNNIEYDDKVVNSSIPKKYYDDHYFGLLRSKTSCIIVDEAHKAIMPMYTCVLRGFGFNFSFKDEMKCNEFGITLVGLTATAFRGTGLERSRSVTVRNSVSNKAKLVYNYNGLEKYTEITFPITCSVCKKPISENEEVMQSTSNKQLVWHKGEEKLSAETTRIYSRFSEPLIPRIYAFEENKKPKAIITCNDKFVAKDPVRISGEKSYDLFDSITKYRWSIERNSSLSEVFGIEEFNKITIIPKHLETIVEELDDPGIYKITLTVENSDGNTDTATKVVEVIPPTKTDSNNEMKELIQNLIKREILCDVYHTSLESGKFHVTGDSIDLGDQIRKQAAENNDRNEKLVKVVHYLLTAPEEKRKKILVFACDILHARVLQLWLKTKYNVSVDYVDSQLHASRNISRIRKFREKSGKEGKVLINTNMLTTGFDVPDVDCVVMGRPVISTVEYTQMIGRGMRGTRMGGTKDVWIIDFDDQVQLSEKMKTQTIPLGWKSMAYDNDQNLIWLPLSDKKDSNGNSLNLELENYDESPEISTKSDDDSKQLSVKCLSCKIQSIGIENISKDFGLSEDEHKDLERFYDGNIMPKLSSLKYCKECKILNTLWSESNDPWKNFVIQEKNDPILLQFIKLIAMENSVSQKINITKMHDVKYLIKNIVNKQGILNLDQIKEIELIQDDEIKIFQELLDDAKEKIVRQKLGVMWTDHIILQKNITMKNKLIELCDYLINPKILYDQLTLIKQKKEENISPDEKIKRETKKIILDVLGYIPEEEEFRKHIGEDLYQYILKKYYTYHAFQIGIGINEYVIKIRTRNECLNNVLHYHKKFKKAPTVSTLESIIPDFKETIIGSFQSIEKFMRMIEQITISINRANNKNVDFLKLKQDYDYVKSKTPWEPTAEEILRYSYLGIGHYVKYAGTIKNFQEIYNLDDNIREKFENLIRVFFELKNSLNAIPDEETMRKYSEYDDIFEFLWFENYEKFLDFLGYELKKIQPNENSTSNKEARSDIINKARSIAKSGGMQELLEKIAKEPELKYVVNFGSMEKFVEMVFPDNKQVALIKWQNIKKKS